jgi:Domain of unknown function (DUF4389)
MEPGATPYPIALAVDPPPTIARWRPFVHWLLAFPHFVVLYLLGLVAGVCSVVAWFVILFTGNLPDGLANVQALYLRYSQRVGTYVLFVREEYPPFSFDVVVSDPGDDPRVRVDVVPQLTDRNRLTVFFRYFLVLPHAIVLALLAIGLWIVSWIAALAVLFTGRWPTGLLDYALGVLRWGNRLSGYQNLLTDEYPPFSLD